MSRAVRNWAIALVVADVVSWVLTIRAHLEFHRAKGGPTVMTLDQLLGWSISVLLLLALITLLIGARMDAKYHHGAARRHTGSPGSPGSPG